MLKQFGIFVFASGMMASFCGLHAADLPAWNFKGKEAKIWVARAHQCRNVRLEDGVLKGESDGRDPFLVSPTINLNASAGHVVKFRAKVGAGGRGVLFWRPFSAKRARRRWSAGFEWIGDGQWHDYVVRPYWHADKKIGDFRIDFINDPGNNMPFEISSVSIVEETRAKHSGEPFWQGEALSAWKAIDGAEAVLKGDLLDCGFGKDGKGRLISPALAVKSDELGVFSVEMMVKEGKSAAVEWACSAVSGKHKKNFKIKPDGRYHTYNVDLYLNKNWKGNVLLLQLSVPGKESNAVLIKSIQLSDEPQGPADISVLQARQVNAINRAGSLVPVYIQLENCGGKDTSNLRLSAKSLPAGVSVVKGSPWQSISEVISGGTWNHKFELKAAKAVKGEAEFVLKGDGADNLIVKMPVDILPDLNLAKADYVPQPIPLKSDYEVGALYFPGWSQVSAWARIWPVAPERKPVLGWYDEANPEVVDWQIKWAVENGISYFLVDWYWHKGHQHHDHWVKAFKKAKYKSYLKFALMWANHNAKGSHSIEDQRKVTKFWIENYFNMPEYYRIDDKPVVMIWSPRNMERDLGKGGCRKLLDLSRQMARAAGYKGIYFIAMKWPEASTDTKIVQGLKDMGFDMTSIYHYMDHGGKAKNPRRFSFDLVADSNYTFWKNRHETGILPFLPNLSTGWDSRPWHGNKGIIIYGRTVDHFQKICRDAKKFADETGVKRLMLAPLNEWGEGSYAEPCAEFGFGMYEAVRDTFCKKPAAGWPQNYAPSDVGLGPYDLPMPEPDTMTEWYFKNGMQGWGVQMGINNSATDEKGLSFDVVSNDPAISRSINNYRARDFSQVAVRMKASPSKKASCQLFWSRGGTPSEATSLSMPLISDGKFHDYVFEVGKKKTWRGRIGYLRFDPTTADGMKVTLESIRLVPAE